MLKEIPLPGRPVTEKERHHKWLKIPRKARAAIRRMHATFGHCAQGPFLEILKASKAPSEYIEAAKYMRCNACEYVENLPKRTNKVSLPRPYIYIYKYQYFYFAINLERVKKMINSIFAT